MLVNDLADTVRGAGITVVEAGDWRHRNHGELSGLRGVVLHHTGSSGSGAWTVVRDGRSDLAGPLAQMTLNRDGSVTVISSGVSWHAGTGSWPSIGTNIGNAYCLGIECVYNGTDITDAQRRNYPILVAALCRKYGIAVGNVIGHREWATPAGRKSDPGQIDLPAFRRTVQALVNGGSTAPSTPPSSPPAGTAFPSVREGTTSALVWRLQQFMNRNFGSYSRINAGPGPTSRCGPQTIAVITEFQKRVGIPTSPPFEIGPKTWAQLVKYGFKG